MKHTIIQELYFDNCGQMEKIVMPQRYNLLQKEGFAVFCRLFEELDRERQALLEMFWKRVPSKKGKVITPVFVPD